MLGVRRLCGEGTAPRSSLFCATLLMTMYISSTRNTRIERMWVEIGTQFAYRWRAFFTRLERRHQLDPNNPAHLWLLHQIFLHTLNSDCADFCIQWNHHPISGKGKDRSPLVRLLHCLSLVYHVLTNVVGHTSSRTAQTGYAS